MEVRPGYKQTEVGVIPEAWEIETMLGISRQIIDYRGRTPKKLGMEWGGGDIPALSAGNVKKGFVDFSEECYFGSAELYRRWMTKGDVAKDDILFTTEAPLGNAALVPDDRRYILSQRTILLQVDQQRASSTFLFQMILSDGFQRMLADYSSGSTARGIQRKKFELLLVALPPPEEQRAIAAALSDVDALLGGLDRLIAKKRDLKQAAMQQLLTGQTRLSGFHGKWEVKRLGDLAEIISGGTPRTNEPLFWNGGIKWCTPTDITRFAGKYLTETERTISRAGLNTSGAVMLPVGALLLCSRATIGELKIAGAPICTNQGFKSLVCRPDVCSEFLYYSLLTMKQQMIERAFGSTFLEISTRNVFTLEVAAPPIDEQSAIAAVLSDMDAEIAALEARRAKTRALKQAMMQELLTGRTRLV
jgi:type I restriction enzyme S subunit